MPTKKQQPIDVGQPLPPRYQEVLKRADRETRGLPPHHAAIARRKVEWLCRFWLADEAAAGRGRGLTRDAVVKQIRAADPKARVTVKSMERWETIWKAYGASGLAGIRGYQFKKKPAGAGNLRRGLLDLAPSALVRLVGQVLLASADEHEAAQGLDKP